MQSNRENPFDPCDHATEFNIDLAEATAAQALQAEWMHTLQQQRPAVGKPLHTNEHQPLLAATDAAPMGRKEWLENYDSIRRPKSPPTAKVETSNSPAANPKHLLKPA